MQSRGPSRSDGKNAIMNPADLFKQDSDLIILEPGEALFREGERGDEMFVVLQGTVDVMAGAKIVDSAQTSVRLLGEMALIDGSPRSASAIARTAQCKLAKINLRRFHFFWSNRRLFSPPTSCRYWRNACAR